MKQRTWTFHQTNIKYDILPNDRVFRVKVKYFDREIKRKVIVQEARESYYAGLLMSGDLVLGSWRWDLKKFEHPVLLSNTVISTDGIQKRYINNPLVAAIEGVVRAIWSEIAA